MDHSTSTKVAVLLIYDPCNFTFGSFFLNVHVFSLLFSNTSDPTSILAAHLIIKLELLMISLLFSHFSKSHPVDFCSQGRMFDVAGSDPCLNQTESFE